MTNVLTFFRMLRVKHWIKNSFVFAALIFARSLDDIPALLRVISGFAVFCGAASAIYIFNDIYDRESDTNHPVKSKRPIASGQINLRFAWMVCVLLCIVSLTGGWFINFLFFITVLIYVLQNVLYTLLMKHVVILDIFFLALGFVLRVIGGGFAAEVYISPWMIICTILLSLFLGFAKRRHELVLLGKKSESHRRILAEYSTTFLDQMIAVVTACTVTSYMLYTIDERTVEKFGSNYLIFTSVFVLYGIFRYLYLVYKKEVGGSPTKVMITDIPLIINVLLWGITCVVIIYVL